MASELASVRQELEEIRAKVVAADYGANASANLAAQLEVEKTGLQQQLQEQDQQTAPLAAELQQVRSQFTAGQSEFEQLNQLHQQSPHDLKQAHECLQTAEQALQESAMEASLGTEETDSLTTADEPADDLVLGELTPDDELVASSAAWAESYAEDDQPNEPTSDVAALDTPTEADTPTETDQTDIDTGGEAIGLAASDATLGTSTAFDKCAEEPEEPEEPAEEFQPPSFIDQYQHLLEENDGPDLGPVPSEPAPASVVNKLASEIDAAGALSEEDSDEAALEVYMSNMMRRVRGDASDDDPQVPLASSSEVLNQNPNPVTAVDNVLQRVAAESEPPVVPLDDGPLDMEKIKRSSRKPALPTDLAAMRELANSSARRAIAQHHKRRHLEKASGFFVVCLIAICVGAYMLMTAFAAQDFLSFKFMSGALAVLTGLVGGVKLLGQLLLVIREGAWEKKRPAKVASVERQLPIGGSVASVEGDG